MGAFYTTNQELQIQDIMSILCDFDDDLMMPDNDTGKLQDSKFWNVADELHSQFMDLMQDEIDAAVEFAVNDAKSDFDDEYETIRSDGYSEGYDTGYDEGHDVGYDKGYDDGTLSPE